MTPITKCFSCESNVRAPFLFHSKYKVKHYDKKFSYQVYFCNEKCKRIFKDRFIQPKYNHYSNNKVKE